MNVQLNFLNLIEQLIFGLCRKVKSTSVMDKLNSLIGRLTTNENNSEEYTVETRSPLVRTKDLYNGLVQVEIFIPGLEPGRDKYHPKRGSIKFDIFGNGYSLDVKTKLVDKTKKTKTIWRFNVKQLPGRVDDVSEKKFVVEKGKIIITLEKHPNDINIDWKPAVQSRGLDQLSSSSSSDDD